MQLSSACNSINCTSAFPYGHGVLSFAAEMLYTCHFITQQIKKMLLCDLDSFKKKRMYDDFLKNTVLTPHCTKE